MNKKVIIGIVLAFVAMAALFGSCSEDSEYERAGKEFGSWVNKGPENWSNTEKEYFNNFMDWANKH